MRVLYILMNVAFFFLLTNTIEGQEIPPILNFSSNTYGAENQNWAITQDDDLFIYVANNAGMLEYNGATWKLYPLPTATAVRSVLAVEERVYCGSYKEFGYWQEDDQGDKTYHSLSDELSGQLLEDEIFWRIETIDDYLMFQSYDRIYFYQKEKGELTYLTDKKNYYRIFTVNNEVYVHKHDGILYRIDNGQEIEVALLPVKYGIKFIMNIFIDGDDLIILTRNEGFFRFREGRIERWNIEAANFLKESKVFSGIQLADKRFVIGTISDGLVILSPDGQLLQKIDQSQGLSNNTVLNLFEDQTGNVWLALDNGIDCLNMGSFIREYNNKRGDVGTTYCSIRFGDKTYIGTNQGLFYKQIGRHEDLRQVANTKGQVWSLFDYKGTLFCSHNSGIYVIENDHATLISAASGAWKLVPIPRHPDQLLFGHYAGLGIINKTNGSWSLSHTFPEFKISSRFVEMGADYTVWVNHENKGVYKLELSQDLKTLSNIQIEEKLPKGIGSCLTSVEGSLIYSYPYGVYRLGLGDQYFVKDSALSLFLLNYSYSSGKLVYDDKDRLWSFNSDNISYATESLTGDAWDFKNIPIENTFRKTTVTFENISHLGDDQYLVGKTNGYILVDLDQVSSHTHKIYLNQISLKERETIQTSISINQPANFKSNQNSLSFHYSVPSFSKYENVHYQYKLDGISPEWSAWTTTPSISFEKLSPGDYQFGVRSRIGEEISENIASYNFDIQPPFYLSKIAWLAYMLLTLFIIYVTHQFYNRSHLREKEKVIRDNQRLMDLQRMQSEQALSKLKNEKLNHEIESKNRELAISAMSIVKRNEVLRSIKRELKNDVHLGDKNHPVFKLIEKNLNNSKDQQFFMEAFDNADKGFIKRAKSIHPELTPNDLKFCAYLRLNITSKEIAPLLNISVKSVEVRRTRLRKKLGLTHGANLVDYILAI